MNTKLKKMYLPLIMTVETISMEEGIAAGSAVVKPGSSNSEIKHEWENGADIDFEFKW